MVFAGVTVILAVVAPVLHVNALPVLAVSNELCPGQTLAGVGVILAVALFETVTVVVAVAVHPPTMVTVTV